MHVVRHEVSLDYLDPLPLAQLPEDLPEVLPVLVVDCLSPILWAKHDVVLAHPLGVREAVRLLCHGVLLPPAAGDLNNHHPREGGVSLHSFSTLHPLSGWLSVPHYARHRLKPLNEISPRNPKIPGAFSHLALPESLGGFVQYRALVASHRD